VSKKLVLAGISIEECVDIGIKGVEEGAFVIHTHPQTAPFLKKWWSNLLDGKPGYADNPFDITSLVKQTK